MEHLNIRNAGPADDGRIKALLGASPASGPLSVGFTYEPSFFGSLPVQGTDPSVVVADSSGKLVGVGSASKRRVFVNGFPLEIGYLNSLRIAPQARGSTILARGYRHLRKIQDETLRVPFYLTTIMEGNETAFRNITGGRAGLPTYKELGLYETFLIPIPRRRRDSDRAGCRVEAASKEDFARLPTVLSRMGVRKQFFPACSAQDLAGGPGQFQGLRPGDFLVAKAGGEMVGTLGLWDQSAFRQVRIVRYGPFLQILRTASAALGSIIGGSVFPRPGEQVAVAMAACVTCKGNDPAILNNLLVQAVAELRQRGMHWLAIGLSAEDPLKGAVESFRRITLHSRIYQVWWGDPGRPPIPLDARVKYLELGSL